MKLGLKLARMLIGGLFVGHGTQKLFGWFGGHGPDATGQFFESLGLHPGKQNALAAGAAEAAGGALLATGILSPLGLAALSGSMTTAVRKVHGRKGIWNSEGGMEYNLVLTAAAFAIVEDDRGLGWALAGLGAGIAGSTAIVELARREAPASAPAPVAEPVHEQPQPEVAATAA